VSTESTSQIVRSTNVKQAQIWFLLNVGLVYFWIFVLDYVIRGIYFSQKIRFSFFIFAVATVSILNFYLAFKTQGVWLLAYIMTGLLTIVAAIAIGFIGIVPVIPHLPLLIRAIFNF
jgi:hypothetical protein